MLKKVLCFLLGHKTVHKAYTGEKMCCVGVLGNEYDILMFHYNRTSFCTRCGKDVVPNKLLNLTDKSKE